MHRLLRRQLTRHTAGGPEAIPAEWATFVAAVDEAYAEFDSDRAMLERSLELSSRELLQANSEMRGIFQAFPDLFFRLDSQGTILDHKGASRGDFYLDPKSLTGKRIQDIPVAAVRQKFEDGIRAVVTERRLARFEYSLQLGEREVHYEARMLPVLDQQLVVIIRNITDQKVVKQELAETTRSNMELERFAYIASHDLQEPLRTVQSYLQLLTRRYGEKLDKDAREFINYAVEGAKRMRELIQDLLSYARLSSRTKPFEPTELGRVLTDVSAALRTAVHESGAQLHWGQLPTLAVDRSQIAQLLQNLISNALKFRSKTAAPVVTISAEPVGRAWRFAVQDNGIGIDPAYNEKVFEIFQRLHSREAYAGTGMGLAICKKIVERHGGRIWVDSRVGQGATFYFTLDPAASKEQETRRDSKGDGAGAGEVHPVSQGATAATASAGPTTAGQ